MLPLLYLCLVAKTLIIIGAVTFNSIAPLSAIIFGVLGLAFVCLVIYIYNIRFEIKETEDLQTFVLKHVG